MMAKFHIIALLISHLSTAPYRHSKSTSKLLRSVSSLIGDNTQQNQPHKPQGAENERFHQIPNSLSLSRSSSFANAGEDVVNSGKVEPGKTKREKYLVFEGLGEGYLKHTGQTYRDHKLAKEHLQSFGKDKSATIPVLLADHKKKILRAGASAP